MAASFKLSSLFLLTKVKLANILFLGMLESSGTLPRKGSQGDIEEEVLGETGPNVQSVYPGLGRNDPRVSRTKEAAEDLGLLNISDWLGI